MTRAGCSRGMPRQVPCPRTQSGRDAPDPATVRPPSRACRARAGPGAAAGDGRRAIKGHIARLIDPPAVQPAGRNVRAAPRAATLVVLARDIVSCRACPRLTAYARRCAVKQPEGWWRPVPGVGPPTARLWVVGLAPGARGAGLTGEPFTRDASARFLRSALMQAGLAEHDVYLSNAVRCVPPGNRPSAAEIRCCGRFLEREWHLVRAPAVLCLGRLAWTQVIRVAGLRDPPPFRHGIRVTSVDGRVIVASYHVSPLNVHTGRLTARRFATVLRAALSRSGEPWPVHATHGPELT